MAKIIIEDNIEATRLLDALSMALEGLAYFNDNIGVQIESSCIMGMQMIADGVSSYLKEFEHENGYSDSDDEN